MDRLSWEQARELAETLQDIFTDRNSVEDFLRYRLGRRYTQFERRDDTVNDVIGNIVSKANSFLWWPALVRETRNLVPEDTRLAQFALPFGMAPNIVSPADGGLASLTGPQLELKIKAAQSTYNVLTWRKRLGDIEGQVCRVEYPDATAWGTGFLIGPNAVMTNYHVVEEVKNGPYQPGDVRLRFDYKVLDDGVAVASGLVYHLAADWLYDSSSYSEEDSKLDPADPRPDELDYAILRVQGTPGKDPLGGNTPEPNPKSLPRRWIAAPAAAHDFLAQKALYIVQHPDGQPMQVAIDSEAITKVNGNGTRVRYTTTTEPGSSGSPCFGANWDWVAIHHAGDPKYLEGKKPEFNQGVPLAAIRNLLKSRGKLAALGGMI
jgi:hypothetical protein